MNLDRERFLKLVIYVMAATAIISVFLLGMIVSNFRVINRRLDTAQRELKETSYSINNIYDHIESWELE